MNLGQVWKGSKFCFSRFVPGFSPFLAEQLLKFGFLREVWSSILVGNYMPTFDLQHVFPTKIYVNNKNAYYNYVKLNTYIVFL